MIACFADTVYYMALLNPDDEWHDAAMDQNARHGPETRLVTTAWVIAEVLNAFSKQAHRSLVVQLVQSLRADSQLSIIPADQLLFEAGFSLYTNRMDKEWSLTDCISFVVMKRQRITEALTADHHFEQAGFRILLRNSKNR